MSTQKKPEPQECYVNSGSGIDIEKDLDRNPLALVPKASEEIKNYLSRIGRAGGKAGVGRKKARTSAQARKAALARWCSKKQDASA